MTVNSWRMIDAVMYGMIPSAKTVKRLKLPPANKSTYPRIEPACCSNRRSSAALSMPGVGMCPPMR